MTPDQAIFKKKNPMLVKNSTLDLGDLSENNPEYSSLRKFKQGILQR
jgi:hypothetical protein